MKNLIASLLLLVPIFLFAQNNANIKGKLQDQNKEAIPYATVSLLSDMDLSLIHI